MDKETLRSLVPITTSKIPYFNLDDGKFENAVHILSLDERWTLIQNYFKDKDYDYLEDRDIVLSAMTEDFNSMDIEKKLASQKYTFPAEYTMSDSTYIEGEKYVQVDISDASIQVIKYYNLFEFNNWSDYVAEFTDEDFTINNDDELKMEVIYNKYYKHGGYFASPAFNMAFNQLLYVAMQGGMEDFMTEHGCIWCDKSIDSIRFQVIDNEKFSTFVNDWPGIFGGINLHYYISSDIYKYFNIPGKENLKKITVTTTSDGDKLISNRGSQYFPQFKKLSLGEPLIEYDYYYRPDGDRSQEITLVENIA